MPAAYETQSKPLKAIVVQPPSAAQRFQRMADFADPDQKKSRYNLPSSLKSSSPIGYRHRISMSKEEVESILPMLSLTPP